VPAVKNCENSFTKLYGTLGKIISLLIKGEISKVVIQVPIALK
jgi:hypothetical protein